ncbi:MAG: IS1182 family transposase [Eubacteriaceae bacterium]|nr:IS1182 family transposase [Eubacteriaceae bacterium]
MTNYTSYQLKLPIDLSYAIDFSDPVFTFREVIDQLDLQKYFSSDTHSTGRPSYDPGKLLKVILFSFMENGYCSLRSIERSCKTDIRYIWLLDNVKAPSFMTIGNFINNTLSSSIEQIFNDINSYIFERDSVDLDHVYIDGTKIEANSNKYTWVWKKACITSRDKVFGYLTSLLEEINASTLAPFGVKITPREQYSVEHMEEVMDFFTSVTGFDESSVVRGRGHRKSTVQRQYQKLTEYTARLRNYAERIEICGEGRNSYSKTDHDATFMRVKRDYMGNDQLLPAYNMQIGVCDEYIAVVDAQKYASDMDCFVPLMEKFRSVYGKYPRYPVADAGYGSYNNYLYCEEVGMEKYMKFTMYNKTLNDRKYRDDPYNVRNFGRNEEGELICPKGKRIVFLHSKPVKGNRYGRTEEVYECEDCSGCPEKSSCTKSTGNRRIYINRELTAIHEEVFGNLESTHGHLLRTNRSIQAEGTYGIIKWDRSYRRVYRRGLKNVILEFTLISCGFNLYKYHNRKKRQENAA